MTFKLLSDINECEGDNNECTPDAEGGHCTNTEGGYHCDCKKGFTGNCHGHGGCKGMFNYHNCVLS